MDLLVIYTENTAFSASDLGYKENHPFSYHSKDVDVNSAYEFLLSQCKKRDLSAAFSTTKDIIGAGEVSSYWVFEGEWKRVLSKAKANLIYVKFNVTSNMMLSKRRVLLSDSKIETVSEEKVLSLFEDKLKIYESLSEFAIPTVEIGKLTKDNLEDATKKLFDITNNHRNSIDFGDMVVIKDRFGASGENMIQTSFNAPFKEIESKLDVENMEKRDISYVVQPYIQCDKGFKIGSLSGTSDMRLLMLNDKRQYAYIRLAKAGEFRANFHQGGSVVFLSDEQIPSEVLDVATKIENVLKPKHSLYALDFIKSNNGNVYFIEGNSSPGIDWKESNLTHKRRQMQVVEKLVEEFKTLVKK